MKNILTYNQYLKENNGSEFGQYQFGVEPMSLGPGYGFAVDDKISIHSSQDSPYVDQYARTPTMINNLLNIVKNAYKTGNYYAVTKLDYFIEDLDKYTEFKILRLVRNNNLNLDIYISFVFDDREFFGVYKNFNTIQRTELKTDLFTDSEYRYIDNTYKLKLNNYFCKVLEKWFRPKKGEYKSLKDVSVKNEYGNITTIPINRLISVINSIDDKDNNAYVTIKHKDKRYILNKNDYYFFNYWFEPVN